MSNFSEGQEGHYIAAACILNPGLDNILMVYHCKYQAYTWPGGHVEPGETLLEAAVREAKEETGIEVLYPISCKMLSLDTLDGGGHPHYAAVFGFWAPEKQALQVCPGENSAVQWLPVEKMKDWCTEAHMLPIYQKALEQYFALLKEKEQAFERLPAALLPWYRANARDLPWRKDRDPYHVWLSEIMLQQTRVEAVKGYYLRFLEAFPTVQALANAPEAQLMKLWEGLGYYNRARNLQKTAQIVVKDYGGRFPSDTQTLLALPGIGAYTAGAIASICFGQPSAAVDGNVLRVAARLSENYMPLELTEMKKKVTAALERVYPAGACGDFTQSLMELGAIVCLPDGQPQCGRCPLQSFCLAHRHGAADQLPVRRPKPARRVEERTVFVFNCNGQLAIQKREKKGLLAGLWEFPNLLGVRTEQEALQTAVNWGMPSAQLEKALHRKHIFTHVQWNMTCYYFQCQEMPQRFQWASRVDFEQSVALPTAFRMFIK